MASATTWKIVNSTEGERIVECSPTDEVNPDQPVVVRTAGKGFVVKQTHPPSHRALSKRIIVNAKLSGCHPCHIFTYRVTQLSDYSLSTEVEFVPGHDVQSYIGKIKTKLDQFERDANTKNSMEFRAHQIQFAKSVARQLIEYVAWLETTEAVSHGNINPTTILLGSDGCIKMKYFRFFTSDKVRANPFHYWKKCAYASPEASCSIDDRMDAGPPNDIWAIGVVLYSIMKGENFLPEYPPSDPNRAQSSGDFSSTEPMSFDETARIPPWSSKDDFLEKELRSEAALNVATLVPPLECDDESDEQQSAKYDAFMRFAGSDSFSDWVAVFADPALAYLAKSCLTKNFHVRPDSSQLLAFMHLAGFGLTQGSSFIKASERGKTIPSCAEEWSEIDDAWSTAKNAFTTMHHAVVAVLDPLWDGHDILALPNEIKSSTSTEMLDEIKSLRQWQVQRCLKPQPFVATAEVAAWLNDQKVSAEESKKNIDVSPLLKDASIEFYQNHFAVTLRKSKVFGILRQSIRKESDDLYAARTLPKSAVPCNANGQTPFHTMVQGRLSCAMMALGRAMVYLKHEQSKK